MLPADFQWIPRGQYAGDEPALTLEGKFVAMLMRKVDGTTWYARLDCQRSITAPVVWRDCSSFEVGKAGIEAWALKHEARLRREVANCSGTAPTVA